MKWLGWFRRAGRARNVCRQCGIEITRDYYPCGCLLRALREDTERKDMTTRLKQWREI